MPGAIKGYVVSTRLLYEKYKRQRGHVIGGWKFVELLGSGNVGDVWEVSKSGCENAAIKILKFANETLFNQFVTEIEILSKLKIAGVIQIIESNIPAAPNTDIPWYVMSKGITIKEGLKNKSTLEILTLFMRLSETLTKLHDLGVIHGDIKPQNILYYQEQLCFCDFGAAKIPEREQIINNMPKAEYAKRIDVSSLAKTLWMMCTKQPKRFDGQYNPNTEMAIKHYCHSLNTIELDNLLIESTDIDKRVRPSAEQFSMRLKQWIKINDVNF